MPDFEGKPTLQDMLLLLLSKGQTPFFSSTPNNLNNPISLQGAPIDLSFSGARGSATSPTYTNSQYSGTRSYEPGAFPGIVGQESSRYFGRENLPIGGYYGWSDSDYSWPIEPSYSEPNWSSPDLRNRLDGDILSQISSESAGGYGVLSNLAKVMAKAKFSKPTLK